MTREFIFLPEFDRNWRSLNLGDNNLNDLEDYLCVNPDAGRIAEKIKGEVKSWRMIFITA